MARLSIEGRQIEAPASCSILQAFLHAGEILAEGVGCMGQGVYAAPAASWSGAMASRR